MFKNLLKDIKPFIDAWVQVAIDLKKELQETNKLLRELNINIKNIKAEA